MNLKKILVIAAVAATLVAGLTVGTGIAGAWEVKESAEAICVGSSPTVTVTVKSDEPRAINLDIYVEDQHQELTGLPAGGSHKFKFSFEGLSHDGGFGEVDYSWADGGEGFDSRTVKYSAVTCVAPTTTTAAPTTTVAPTTTAPTTTTTVPVVALIPPISVVRESAPAKPVTVKSPKFAG